MPAQPVTKEEFACLMAGLGPFGPDDVKSPIALAVSGGGDSMALAFLARSWRVHIIALIVDHGLRPESRQEAELTAQRLSQMGVPFQILTLEQLKSGGLQEQARNARFSVLERACFEKGASILMLAHHQADQEETLQMRVEKKSGLEGMLGMAPRSSHACLTLLRPFLSLRPERLKATLRTAGIAWCEDPSNQNRRFRRVQVRQDLTEKERKFLRGEQERAVRHVQEMEARLPVLMAEKIREQPEGWTILSPDVLTESEPEMADFFLGRLIRRIGGCPYLPSPEALSRLRRKGEGSLGGAVLKKRLVQGKIKDLILYRECRDLSLSVPAIKGRLWDRRWLYAGPEKVDCQIAALSGKAGEVREERSVPVSVLQTVPALWREGQLVAVADCVRGLSLDLPRVSFSWQGGMKMVGAKQFY
ncbi:tRNA lysidine(34) synthetase TilS [Acetobacteraceae bacterium ESL0709]|nr:tRNA lysidine(34) synthetase TilS [Acetobacteraceae bacterium ESL0697]MDF7677600.1 tRNA lysidine(34) synthetase TilS [Acetobacteraceae bacterium ESL0709]